MPNQQYDVRVPRQFFRACAETHEDQFWTDDRGFTFAVVWSDEHNQPMAACVGIPDGDHAENAWHRDTPQPEVIEH